MSFYFSVRFLGGGGNQWGGQQRIRPIQGVDAKGDTQRLLFSGPLLGGGGMNRGGAWVSHCNPASPCHIGGCVG